MSYGVKTTQEVDIVSHSISFVIFASRLILSRFDCQTSLFCTKFFKITRLTQTEIAIENLATVQLATEIWSHIGHEMNGHNQNWPTGKLDA